MTPLVLLHAFPLDSCMYRDVRRELSAEWDVVLPDFPGFGNEPISPEQPSLDVFADFIAGVFDQHGYDRVILGGTSMGGYVSMAFARRHRERLAGLALIDTKAAADPGPAATGRREMAELLMSEMSTRPLMEAVFPKLLGSTTIRQQADIVQRVQRLVQSGDPVAAAWAQRAMAQRPDSFGTLREVTVPSVVVVGSEDQLVTESDAGAMADALPDSDLVVLDEVGHLSPIEASGAVASALTRLRDRVRD